MSREIATTKKHIRIEVPTNSIVHVDGKSTSPPAHPSPLPESVDPPPIETVQNPILIPWFSGEISQADCLNKLVTAVGKMSYLQRIRAYWEVDLAGRLGSLSYKDSVNQTTVHRMFSLELPSDAYMSVDGRKFDLSSAPSTSTDPYYHVDLVHLPTACSPSQIRGAIGHLSLLGFLISMWHTELWKRLGFSTRSWT